MVGIMYVKNLDDENKVCCTLLDCDEKDDALKHLAQLEKALNEEAKSLEFYVQARIEIENIFKESDRRPRRWENYRPLWYREFANELLDVKPYG